MQEELNVYGTRKIKLPKPELYVIYTDDKNIDKEIIRLSDEFCGGDKSTLEVCVKVISGGGDGDIISQYIQFSKIYTEKLKELKEPRRAIIETISLCKDRNILREYLERKESEVEDIMFMLYNQDEINRLSIKDAENQGEKNATKKIVFRMLKKNKSDEDIIEIAEISTEELNQLKAEYAQA